MQTEIYTVMDIVALVQCHDPLVQREEYVGGDTCSQDQAG